MQHPSSSFDAGPSTARRGHVPQLSISDPTHHVTEAIGHMYDDEDYDSRRLSYVASPLGESITTRTPTSYGSHLTPSATSASSSPSPSSSQSHAREQASRHGENTPPRPSVVITKPLDGEPHPSSPPLSSPSSSSSSSMASEKAKAASPASFQLSDVDYESNPVAVAQELSNLAAIRRMSMDVAAAGDPDLPSFDGGFGIPSLPPSPSADENDASRLFWVPARLHPELAPKEFRSFLNSKAEQIKRKSGDFSSLSVGDGGGGGGGGAGAGAGGAGGGGTGNSSLRRKRSMLSRQVDNANGYTDGAERLERKRSGLSKTRDAASPDLKELEKLVGGSKRLNDDAASLLQGIQNLAVATSTAAATTSHEEEPEEVEDKPILPPAPPGHSLRRSTRTQYRKGSLKKGEKVPYSKRLARASEASEGQSPRTSTSDDQQQPRLGLVRVSTEPIPSSDRTASRTATLGSTASPHATFDTILDDRASSLPSMAAGTATHVADGAEAGNNNTTVNGGPPAQSRQWHSRISSNGRSTLNIPPTEQKIPEIVESQSQSQPPPPPPPPPSADRGLPLASSPKAGPELLNHKRSQHTRQPAKEGAPTATTLADLADSPQLLPGTSSSTRTDSLTFVPILTEDKKPDHTKKSKDKKDKDTEGGRKSSWHWLLGTEEKEKEKEKERKKEKESGESKKSKAKSGDNARLDLLQSSIDGGAAAAAAAGGHRAQAQPLAPRESLVIDRLDPKLEEERRKDSARRSSSGESSNKKEKDSGLFSSIFGSGRKKNSSSNSNSNSNHHSGGANGSAGHHKKSLSRTRSPDPSLRELRPDVDYPWTRFSILEERAIYRMAHIKLANPRRALLSQVLLSNFMYSYLAKVQQMQTPHASVQAQAQAQAQAQQVASSSSQRSQHQTKDQPEEYLQYQRYQEAQDQQQYSSNSEHASSYEDSPTHDYDHGERRRQQSRSSKHPGGYANANGSGYGQQQQPQAAAATGGQPGAEDNNMW